jgi:hypothetical protein
MLIATLIQLVSLSPAVDVHPELISKYLGAMESQSANQRESCVDVVISGSIPKLNRQATLRTLRATSPTGTITYTTLNAAGDAVVIREVIARYIAAESQERDPREIAVTPLNYNFRLKRIIEEPTRQIYIFQLAPKKKKVGLFKGELWVDGQTGLPVHESGRFVKNPSVFIKRVSFTRDYLTKSGPVSLIHTHSTIESRVAGRAELDILAVNPAAQTAAESKHNVE